jgi:hypothetical protein
MQLNNDRMQTTSIQRNPDRHNVLLGQFRLHWNIFQFFVKLDETPRDSLIALNAGFLEAFQRFKQCKVLLQAGPDSDAVHSQLDVLERDVLKLQHELNLADAKVSVDRIRRALEGTDRVADGLCNNLVTYFLSKELKNPEDRDKVDYLITRNFHREYPSLATLDNLEVLTRQVSGFLGDNQAPDQLVPSEYFDRYLSLIRSVQMVGEFHALLNQGILSGIREYKNSLGEYFYHAPILARIIVLNILTREKFQNLQEKENRKTEDQIIKLAEIGGEILLGSNSPESSNLCLLETKKLRDSLTADLHQEYSSNQEKLRHLEQISDLLERTSAFYGLGAGQSLMGSKGSASAPVPLHIVSKYQKPENSLDGRQDDELRKLIVDLELMIRAHAVRGSVTTRLKYRDQLMILSSWETEAFLEARPGSEMQLRIRQSVRRTLGLVFMIQSLLRQGQEFLGVSLPRDMLLSIESSLLRAQDQRQNLEDLVGDVIKRGMKDEAFHLANLQARLAGTVSSVKPLFQRKRIA